MTVPFIFSTIVDGPFVKIQKLSPVGKRNQVRRKEKGDRDERSDLSQTRTLPSSRTRMKQKKAYDENQSSMIIFWLSSKESEVTNHSIKEGLHKDYPFLTPS